MLFSLYNRLKFKFTICLFFLVLFSCGIFIFSKTHWKVVYNSNILNSSNITSEYKYIALIIDDRANKSVINAVLNVFQHIPIDWKVQMVIPYKYWCFYMNSSLSSYIKSNRIIFTSLDRFANGRAPKYYINPILTSALFWRQVKGERVLFFQSDSVLCSNSSSKLTDFLDYDFIGAPWSVGGCCNGGLSIRNRHKTLELLESKRFKYNLNQINEDGWFTRHLPSVNARIAPISVAKKFSVETIYHPYPFAMHKPLKKFLGNEALTKLCKECPELSLISSHCRL